MAIEKDNEKKVSRNGQIESAGFTLQASASHCPACFVRDVADSVGDRALRPPIGRFWRPVSDGSCRQRHTSGRRGAQIIEYAFLIAAVSAAFITMFVYGKRGMQSVIRKTVDQDIGPQTDGLPLAGFMENQFVQTNFDTVSGEKNRAQLTASGGIIYTSDSYASSAGAVTAHMVVQ